MKTKVVSRKPDARPGEELKPRLIAFEVTRRCRYECKHCRASAGMGHKYELSTQQCRKIVAAVAEFAKPILIVTGGEPMEREDIYEIMEYAHEQGLRVVMATCGYMIDAVSLKKLRKAGVSALSFSIDGASADSHDAFRQTNGAFDSIMKAAEMARKTKMPFQINTTVSTLNAGEGIGSAELAKRIGASCWNPFLLVPTGRGEQIADAMLDPIEYESLLGELLRIKLMGDIQVRCTCAPQFARVC
jgi:MoaA/NifB/PqqE/SkfB family radical SAM enzyme